MLRIETNTARLDGTGLDLQCFRARNEALFFQPAGVTARGQRNRRSWVSDDGSVALDLVAAGFTLEADTCCGSSDL